MLEKPVVNIEDWKMVQYFGYFILEGTVKGHPNIPDGHHVYTSALISINFDKSIAETQNTLYDLGAYKE